MKVRNQRFGRCTAVRTTVIALTALVFALPSGNAADHAAKVNSALTKARAENKTVLVHFNGGADWCAECEDFRKEVAGSVEFKDYSRTNFVLVEIRVAADEECAPADACGISVWPTLALLDGSGRAIGKVEGYRKGDGPKVVIQEMEKRRKRT